MGEGPEASVSHSVVSSASIVSRVVGNQKYVFHLYSWTYYGLLFRSAQVGFWNAGVRIALTMSNPTWEVWSRHRGSDGRLTLTSAWMRWTNSLSDGMFVDTNNRHLGLCMYVYICMCICVCCMWVMYVCMCMNVCLCVCMYVCVCVSVIVNSFKTLDALLCIVPLISSNTSFFYVYAFRVEEIQSVNACSF